MGAVRFSIDTGLVRELQQTLPLKVFVETGTYEGASVRAALPLFQELHTVELSATLYARVVEFEENENVHPYHGRSEDVLRQIAPKLKRKSVLYWLDAHWSHEEHSEGAEEQCPLLDELERDRLGRPERRPDRRRAAVPRPAAGAGPGRGLARAERGAEAPHCAQPDPRVAGD